MRNLFLALATVALFSIAAAGSGTGDKQKAACPSTQSCCGACCDPCQ
jgi:hypothetical protein